MLRIWGCSPICFVEGELATISRMWAEDRRFLGQREFYYSKRCCQNFSTLPQVPEPQLPQSAAGWPGKVPTLSGTPYRKGTWSLGNALLCSSLWARLLFVPEGHSISSPRAALCKYNSWETAWERSGEGLTFLACPARHVEAWDTHRGVILYAMLVPILQMGKLRPRKMKWLWDATPSKWQSTGLYLNMLSPELQHIHYFLIKINLQIKEQKSIKQKVLKGIVSQVLVLKPGITRTTLPVTALCSQMSVSLS